MRRVAIFLGGVVVSAVALLAVFFWYLFEYQRGGASLGGVMGQMMGNQYSGGIPLAMPAYVWAVLAILLVALVAGAAGLGYYLVFPEITQPAPRSNTKQSQNPPGENPGGWAVIIRTSKPEERKVLEVLEKHGGTYLQKFVVKEAGLSKLKTHRIVSRLAERGVVSVERSGNTNQVTLAPWAGREAPASEAKTVS